MKFYIKLFTQGEPDIEAINVKTKDRIVEKLSTFVRYGITPVCVFDGKAIELKNFVLMESAVRFNETYKNLDVFVYYLKKKLQ